MSKRFVPSNLCVIIFFRVEKGRLFINKEGGRVVVNLKRKIDFGTTITRKGRGRSREMDFFTDLRCIDPSPKSRRRSHLYILPDLNPPRISSDAPPPSSPPGKPTVAYLFRRIVY